MGSEPEQRAATMPEEGSTWAGVRSDSGPVPDSQIAERKADQSFDERPARTNQELLDHTYSKG